MSRTVQFYASGVSRFYGVAVRTSSMITHSVATYERLRCCKSPAARYCRASRTFHEREGSDLKVQALSNHFTVMVKHNLIHGEGDFPLTFQKRINRPIRLPFLFSTLSKVSTCARSSMCNLLLAP